MTGETIPVLIAIIIFVVVPILRSIMNRANRPLVTPRKHPMSGLVFKDGPGLFRYMCEYMPYSAQPRKVTAALVKASIEYPKEPALQLVFLDLPNNPIPIAASGLTTGYGPTLKQGDLVAFYETPDQLPNLPHITGVIPAILDTRWSDNGLMPKEFFQNGARFIQGVEHP